MINHTSTPRGESFALAVLRDFLESIFTRPGEELQIATKGHLRVATKGKGNFATFLDLLLLILSQFVSPSAHLHHLVNVNFTLFTPFTSIVEIKYEIGCSDLFGSNSRPRIVP